MHRLSRSFILVQWMKGFVKVTLSKSILAFGNLVIVIQSSSSVQLFCDSTRLVPARLLFLCPWDYPDKDTEVGCCFHLQGIFPIQESNLSLLHWQVDFLPLSHQGSSLTIFLNLNNSVVFLTLYIGEKKKSLFNSITGKNYFLNIHYFLLLTYVIWFLRGYWVIYY